MKIEKDKYGDEKLVIENNDDIYTFSEAYDELRRKAAPIAKAMLELRGIKEWVDEDDIYMDYGNLYAKYTVGGYGCYDDETIQIPSEYLFNPEWLESAKVQLEKEREKERKKQEAARIKREKAHEEAEKKKYLELKEKYGDLG